MVSVSVLVFVFVSSFSPCLINLGCQFITNICLELVNFKLYHWVIWESPASEFWGFFSRTGLILRNRVFNLLLGRQKHLAASSDTFCLHSLKGRSLNSCGDGGRQTLSGENWEEIYSFSNIFYPSSPNFSFCSLTLISRSNQFFLRILDSLLSWVPFSRSTRLLPLIHLLRSLQNFISIISFPILPK